MKWAAAPDGKCNRDCPALRYEDQQHHYGRTFCRAWGLARLGEWPWRDVETAVDAECVMERLRKVLVDRELD